MSNQLLIAGSLVELEIMREAAFGYFLSNGTEDVLLHKKEITSDKLKIGDMVEVFLYHDHQNRLTATMQAPTIIQGEADWLKVVEVQPSLGVFLDMNIARDLLLPYSELPLDKQEWPAKGDALFVELANDRMGRMIGKLSDTNLFLEEQKVAHQDVLNQELLGRAYKLFPDGAFLVTEERYLLFLPRSEMTKPLRLGEEIKVRITYVREDGRLNASTKPPKQEMIHLDAEQIMTYLANRGGSMPYYDKTAPDIIQEKFSMSKAAFKRALGHLMKNNKIYQEDGWTYLKE